MTVRPLSSAAIAAGIALVTAIRVASAAPSCTASCVARMAACRAERCPGTTGTDRRHCRDVCRAVTGCAAGAAHIRTLATVVNECHAANGTWTVRQRLEVRRGDCPPVTLLTVEASEPVVDFGLCQLYGEARDGAAGMSVGALQGVAVSPDGDTVLFQVTDDFVGGIVIGGFTIPSPRETLASEGIFRVRADGTGLRRLAPQSREAPFAIRPGPVFPGIRVLVTSGFSFSPNGLRVVFTDRGPGSDGSDAPQLFTLDVDTGLRQQVTHFTGASVGFNPDGVAMNGIFIDDDRLGGFVYDSVSGPELFVVRRDGSEFRPLDPPVGVPGAHVVPDFRVSTESREVTSLALDEMTDLPQFGAVREVFVFDRDNALQLTRIGRSDTLFSKGIAGGSSILFAASGDPLERNPSNTCQLFTIDRLGGHMRQLTRFDPSATSPAGCFGGAPPPGCTTSDPFEDPRTGTIIFDSSCDPLGLSAVSQQLFAIRPTGSGFRQLTAYGGLTTAPDGAVNVEMPGPLAYSAPDR